MTVMIFLYPLLYLHFELVVPGSYNPQETIKTEHPPPPKRQPRLNTPQGAVKTEHQQLYVCKLAAAASASWVSN